MKTTPCSLIAVLAFAIVGASVTHAQEILFDFQDGTDQGWSAAFADDDATLEHPIVDVNGDGNLWLQITSLGGFFDEAGFTQSNNPDVDFNIAFYAAVNNPTTYVVEFDYIIDTSATTDPGTFFQVSNFFQSGEPGFSFVRPSSATVELGMAELMAASVHTGTASFPITPGLTGSDEMFARFGFSTNGDAFGDVLVSLDNIRIGPAETDILKGDINLDGSVTFLDINPFIVLLAANGFQDEADCDCDGDLDFLDIQPFIDILAGN